MGGIQLTDPGDRAVRFINNLTLSDDFLGQPMRLRPWQEDIVRRLKTTRPDGSLAIRKAFLMLPRKQAKTQLSACLATEHILGTPRTGQTAVVAASDRYQAGHLFKKVKTIIEADAFLDRQCRIYSGVKRIETRKTGNVLQVLSSDGRRAHGENPSLAILDEVWTQPNTELFDALTSGFGTRTEYLTLLISTQGNRRDSLVYQQYEYAKGVLSGKIVDPEYLAILYEAKAEDDWTSEETWRRAMPALGDFASLEFIRSEFRLALEIPSEESKFRQFYLNQLVAASSKWVNRAKWDLCGEKTFDPKDLVGRPCFAGLDLSSTSDITAMVLVFPMDDGSFRVICHFWIPENYAIERDRKGHTQYRRWQQRGHLKFTSGGEIDYPEIEADIPKILAPYKVQSVLVDPYNATSTTQRLAAAKLPVVKCRQGWQTMSDPIKYTEVLISKGLLWHGDNPVLNWMADNVVVHRDRQDNLTFDKLNSADKIDGFPAMVMGVAGATLSKPKPANAYSTRRPEFVERKSS